MEESANFPFQHSVVSQGGVIYESLQLLGTGGSAETYLVLATSGPVHGLLFALKVFRRVSRPEWRDSFLREIGFLRTCSHPAIMRVFDEGLDQDRRPFVIAEYLPQTLANALPTATSMVEKLSFALQMLSALEYLGALETPVVHRDIKPQNIFLKGRACVLGDFGLMKLAGADRETDQQLLKESTGPRMPRYYRTPDLVDYLKGGPPPTPKSDVFQLGLVFAELFSGRNPEKPMPNNDFETPIELEPIGPVRGELGEPIKFQINRMLVFEPESRPSATTLIREWQEFFLEACQRAHALEGRVF